VWLALAICPRAYALNPLLDVNQYVHTSWTVRDGVFDSSVMAIAQTPDGYLWVGTESGLVRFDGVRFAPWETLPGAAGSGRIRGYRLLAARDGSLWIVSRPGVVRLKDGRLYRYPSLDAPIFLSLAEGRDGRIWLGSASNPVGQLCDVDREQVRCVDARATPGATTDFIGMVTVDAAGSVWLAGLSGLARWDDRAVRSFPLPFQSSGYAAMPDENGALLVSTPDGLARFKDGHLTIAYPSPPAIRPSTARVLLRDRDGSIWVGTQGKGLLHVHDRVTDVFNQTNGLSGNSVNAVFEDREGSIWVATNNGLDRFRDASIPRFSVEQGLASESISSVLAARDGSVWVATAEGLNRWRDHHVSVYRETPGSVPADVREVTGRGLPERAAQSLFEDRRGRIWISDGRAVGFLEGDRFVPVITSAGPFQAVAAIAEDANGDVWVLLRDSLAHVRNSTLVERIPHARLDGAQQAQTIAADSGSAGVWIGSLDGTVVHLAGSQIDRTYAIRSRSGQPASVFSLRTSADGILWASTAFGMARLANGRVSMLDASNGLPCDAVHWSIEDDAGSLWMALPCGIVRVSRDSVSRWMARTDTRVSLTLFTSADGASLTETRSRQAPQVSKGPEGRIWVASRDGVRLIDPPRLERTSLAPPVYIEQLTADGKAYDASEGHLLPPRVRNLEIGYTALSLVAPERNRFRVMLEGRDRDWQDVGTRRQAFYTDLGPGNYRFRVVASNNSGVWNETGATLDFSIAPAYYQTRWFAVLVIVGTAGLLWIVYQLRVAQLARQFNRTLEARVSERTRIARDLHDTMLQSFQGALLRFQSVSKVIKTRPDEASERLERALDQAEAAITEGRNAVQGLRASATTLNDLAKGIAAIGAELTSDPSAGNVPAINVEVDGRSRDLNPVVRDEAFRIAGEALRNAVKHAEARRVVVTIHYEPRQLRLVIHDDGKGIPSDTLARQRLAGHFGLPGMRERAAIVKGRLEVRSAIGFGTEIELRVPSAIAYSASARPSWSRVFRRTNRHA
jgi:signal transduction histidine kinase/ligand-binding sensor domain-containing protein